MSNERPPESIWWRPWLPAVLIFAVTLLCYASVYDAGFIWDDDDYVTQNPLLRDWSGLWRIWFSPTELPQYYPLVHSTFWLEFQLTGANPAVMHVVNVLLHATGALLLFRALRRLAVPGALLAALVFAVHPVHVESVAWITERKNVLSGVCYLLALNAWLRWLDTSPGGPGARRWWGIALLWFVAALLSKTVTCSLPAALLLIGWWRNGRVGRRELLGSVPFFLIGLALALVTAALERSHVRAEGAEFAFTAFERLLIAGRAPWFYLGALVWPVNLSFNYERWVLDTASMLQWAFPIATVGLLATLFFLRNRIGRGPLVAMLFFGGSLFPALGFFNVFPMRYSFVADHFQYLASLGPIVLGVALFARAAAKVDLRIQRAAAAVAVLTLGSMTFVQGRIYQDLETLWNDTIEKNPKTWLARTNLAGTLLQRGDYAGAIRQLETAISIYDAFETRLGFGVVQLFAGEPAEARMQLERAVELAPHRNDAKAWLGLALHRLGESAAAREVLEESLAMREDYDRAHAFLGQVLQAEGRSREAIPHLERAIQLNPGAIDAIQIAAKACAAIGDSGRAVFFAASALASHGDDVISRDVFVEVLADVLPRVGEERAVSAVREVFAKVPAARTLGERLHTELRKRSPEVAAVAAAIGLQ